MGAAPSVGERDRLVIVGAGYGGVDLAQLAAPRFRVTVIEKRKCFLPYPAGVRCVVSPEWSAAYSVPNENLFKGTTDGNSLVYDEVVKVDTEKREVQLLSGGAVEYDWLVLAVGSASMSPCEAPTECDDALKCGDFFKSIADKISAAKHVCVVGGGPTGTEIAGEIRQHHPSVKVTLVESRKQLCDGLSDKLSKRMERLARDSGVTLCLNDKVKLDDAANAAIEKAKVWTPADGVVSLESGAKVEAVDLLIPSIGNRPRTKFLTDSPQMGDAIDERGLIKVEDSLQVVGHPKIFAIGDCNNVTETKLAINAGSNRFKGVVGKMMLHQGNADVVFDNLLLLQKGMAPKPYKTGYSPPSTIMVTWGNRDGATVGVPGFLISAKAKKLFLDDQYKRLNQPIPEILR
eukprot:Selendium_serpulae@DN4890_c0_g1_i2.p1